MAELLVERGIGQIAARRHIDVVQHDRLRLSVRRVEPDGEMPRVAAAANVAALLQREGEPRERGDAVIALLPRHRDMRKAERAKLELGKLALDAFDLLQAQHVGLLRLHEAADEIEPEPDRIDVPGGEAEAHGKGKDRCGNRQKQAEASFRPLNAQAK